MAFRNAVKDNNFKTGKSCTCPSHAMKIISMLKSDIYTISLLNGFY